VATITKVLQKLIKDRVTLADGPMYFHIYGKSGMGYTRAQSTHITWTKLKAWAESRDAEATVIKSENYGESLVVEITDPAAQIIEKLLQPK
jgi:deoxyxylulose-5-phosphate synthase